MWMRQEVCVGSKDVGGTKRCATSAVDRARSCKDVQDAGSSGGGIVGKEPWASVVIAQGDGGEDRGRRYPRVAHVCWLLLSKGAKAIRRQAHRARQQRATETRRHPHHAALHQHARTQEQIARPPSRPQSGQPTQPIRFLPTRSAVIPQQSWPGPGRTYGQRG
jgi:hypothetical protein